MTTKAPEKLSLHERARVFSEVVSTTDRSNVFRVRIISPGAGSSSYYTAGVIERDGPIVFTPGTKAYADHSTWTEQWERPERSVLDIVGKQVSEAVWEPDAAEGPGLYADYEYKAEFIEGVITPFGDVIGVSISAYGDVVRDEYGEEMILTIGDYTGTVIERLIPDPFTSVDVVTVPGRDGRIIERLTEAMKPFSETKRPAEPRRTDKKEEESMDEQTLKSLLAESNQSLLEGLGKLFGEKLTEALAPQPPASEAPTEAELAEAAVTSGISELTESGKRRVLEGLKVPDHAPIKDLVEAEKAHEAEIRKAFEAELPKGGIRREAPVLGGTPRVSEAKSAIELGKVFS